MEVVSWWAAAIAAARKCPVERREARGVDEIGCLEEVRKTGGTSYGLGLLVCVLCREGVECTNCVRGWYISGRRR